VFLAEFQEIVYIQEYKKSAWEKVCVKGAMPQAKTRPAWCPKWASVETWQRWRKHALKVLPTHSRLDTAEPVDIRVGILHYAEIIYRFPCQHLLVACMILM
jgi:hypothetical protein